MTSRPDGGFGRRRAILLSGFGMAAALAALAAFGWRSAASHVAGPQLLSRARAALQRSKFDAAEEFAGQVARDDEVWASAQLVAGEAATRAGRRDAAIKYYDSLPRDGSREALIAAFSLGELARDSGRLSEAERHYAYVLDHQPANALVRERMAFLLGVTGRRWESLPHLMFLLRDGSAKLDDLVLVGDLERAMEQGDYLRQCEKNAPSDVLVELGLAALAVADGRSTEARGRLREIVARAPHLVAAHAMLGELLVDADDAKFVEWQSGLPAAADEHPETWFVRGLWARRRDSLRVAARCFWETVRRAPTHRRGTYQLGQVLMALGETPGADFSERSARLFELTQALDNVLRSRGRDEESVKRIVSLMEQTGRVWEACAWAAAAVQTFSSAEWPRQAYMRLAALLNDDTPQTLDTANLSLKYDLSQFPNSDDLLVRVDRQRFPPTSLPGRSSILFEEERDSGINFAYVNGGDPGTKGARMFEQTGGGVAVLDFDGDGWPDLYFTQGTEWKHGSSAPSVSGQATDRLYRNAAGHSFVDVTQEACLIDHGFGQGCAAGDFDDDGFLDLYVANIGRNQLHHNNGDGTFADVTARCGLTGDDWTTSCAIVDLNADGLPDLFDVTYVAGANVYDAICNGHGCSPKVFKGVPDRLHVNCGNGTFEPVTIAAPESASKGLGVVAVELYERGRPCLFVANDQVPSFFLRNFDSDDRFHVRLVDEGFASGLAFNEDGLALAAMGIAADDVNGDGRIDFYVTTFKNESKILYLQDASGLFVDATNAAGLRSPSLSFVGWGTQFLDADCDGEPDLVVANGHVDDYRDQGGEYHMRPQFFRNTGAGRFVELFAGQAGAFFGRKALGRGLARLDWNRDGRMDFVVSNIGARASLVTNRSTEVGHFLNVRLHARATARDAIGSVVDVVAGERRWSKQLVAGDGYMASNERMLQFGLADAARVTELRVQWPSGDMTTLRDIPIDTTLEVVEGAPASVLWRGSQPGSFPVDPDREQ